jgi:hypothetical protein
LNPSRSPQLAIEGENYTGGKMNPQFCRPAVQEQDEAATREFDGQITASTEHAKQYGALLARAVMITKRSSASAPGGGDRGGLRGSKLRGSQLRR